MPCRFEIGDRVIALEWDAAEPPCKRLGLCMVVATEEARCESGWVVRVESLATCEQLTLDQNWLSAA
jgi:hypothetical protein